MPDGYAPNVGTEGKKFNTDGTVRNFPGNTIICMLAPDSRVYQLMVQAQERLAKMGCFKKFAMLPSSSLHMTVIEGVCDQVREEGKWPSSLPLSTPLAEVRQFFKEQVSEISAPSSFRMSFMGVGTGNVIKIDIKPADETEEESMARYRDEVASRTGLRLAGHDTYAFHISLAYRIEDLSVPEMAELDATVSVLAQSLTETFGCLETGPPQLCFFEDMFSFVPDV